MIASGVYLTLHYGSAHPHLHWEPWWAVWDPHSDICRGAVVALSLFGEKISQMELPQSKPPLIFYPLLLLYYLTVTAQTMPISSTKGYLDTYLSVYIFITKECFKDIFTSIYLVCNFHKRMFQIYIYYVFSTKEFVFISCLVRIYYLTSNRADLPSLGVREGVITVIPLLHIFSCPGSSFPTLWSWVLVM